MTGLTEREIAEIRGDLFVLALTLNGGNESDAESEDDEAAARAALAAQILRDLQQHREVFNPARLALERERQSVTQGTVLLRYMSDEGVELWRCRLQDDIRLTVITDAADVMASGTQNPHLRVCTPAEAEARGLAFGRYTGSSRAELEAFARRVFVHGDAALMAQSVGLPHGHGLRTRDDAALLGAARTLCAQAQAFVGDHEVAEVVAELAATLNRLSEQHGWAKSSTPKPRRMEAM